jgi:hypothetical protein
MKSKTDVPIRTRVFGAVCAAITASGLWVADSRVPWPILAVILCVAVVQLCVFSVQALRRR